MFFVLRHKTITSGEGGMITTNRPEWVDPLKIKALHGMDHDAWKRYSDEGYRHYQVVAPGFKYNMTDIQAALLLPQLKQLDSLVLKRKQIWARYSKHLAEIDNLITLKALPNSQHAYYLYKLMVKG